jgi:spermidine synthase
VVYLLATVVGSQGYRISAASSQPVEGAAPWSLLALFAVVPVFAADPLLPLGSTLYNGMRFFSIGLFCVMAGFLTPFLVDSWSSGNPDRAGSAYAVNIAGSIVGPLIAGFWLLPWVGARWSVFLLSLPLFAIAALTLFGRSSFQAARSRFRLAPILQFAIPATVAILLFARSHDYETKFAKREVRRDYAATVVATGTGMDRKLLVNGVDMTNLNPITKYIVHLPMAFMNRPPRNGLVICFGMGTSFRSMLTWGIPTTAVDLIPSVPELFSYYHSDAPKLVSSPLARIVIDDGRRFLDGSGETYDVIVVDPPPPPQAAGSSLLYSTEFYEVVKKHLRKGGIFLTWYPEIEGDAGTTVSVTKALMESFPNVRAFSWNNQDGVFFMASMEPIPLTSSAVLAARLPPAAASDFVEWGPLATPQQQFELVVSQEVALEGIVAKAPRAPAMQDDQPINEYFLLRPLFHFYR